MSSKGIGTSENKELAFQVYREYGGKGNEDIAAAINTRHGFSISVQTLNTWRTEGDWDGRIERADQRTQRAASTSFEVEVLGSLMDRQKEYENFFENSDKKKLPDTQAMYAYTNLLKTIFDIKAKMGSFKTSMFLEFMEEFIKWSSVNASGLTPLLAESFDDFMTYAREKYSV